ncbi:DUF1524 domain-containing protein [Streptomyces canus]|uniref:GmrSD restriction endonuclease domain-containing protein n=1 Tax=Streptomyces canus TaxID=58343 RepID=UPI0036EDAE2A
MYQTPETLRRSRTIPSHGLREGVPPCVPPPPGLRPPHCPYSPSCSPPPPTPPTQPPAPATRSRCSVRDALAALPVQTESRTGYERTKFRHWTDADRDGYSTRNEVLLDEAVTAPEQDASCRPTGGSWYSPYDNTYFTAARALDIDHLVPLAEAWDSGASTWTAQERETYANDLDDPRALIAVSATSNRSKPNQDPATWTPPGRRLPVHLRHRLDHHQNPLEPHHRPERADRPHRHPGRLPEHTSGSHPHPLNRCTVAGGTAASRPTQCTP